MKNIEELARSVEGLTKPSRKLDAKIYCALFPHPHGYKLRAEKDGSISVYVDDYWHHSYTVAKDYTSSIDDVRSLGGMVVFASDIGADGLAMVKLVVDTGTTPVVEHTGIAANLEFAWLAAVLRSRTQSAIAAR